MGKRYNKNIITKQSSGLYRRRIASVKSADFCVMQKNNKNKIWDSCWWSIEYPESWQVNQDESCTTFTSLEKIGALQISSYRKDEIISESEIFDFAADDIEDTNKLKKIKEENYEGFSVSYIEDITYWKRYYLWKDHVMIYITYNCEAKEKDSKETNEIEGILKTLKIKKTA